jgi:hypothetical protein
MLAFDTGDPSSISGRCFLGVFVFGEWSGEGVKRNESVCCLYDIDVCDFLNCVLS